MRFVLLSVLIVPLIACTKQPPPPDKTPAGIVSNSQTVIINNKVEKENKKISLQKGTEYKSTKSSTRRR